MINLHQKNTTPGVHLEICTFKLLLSLCFYCYMYIGLSKIVRNGFQNGGCLLCWIFKQK